MKKTAIAVAAVCAIVSIGGVAGAYYVHQKIEGKLLQAKGQIEAFNAKLGPSVKSQVVFEQGWQQSKGTITYAIDVDGTKGQAQLKFDLNHPMSSWGSKELAVKGQITGTGALFEDLGLSPTGVIGNVEAKQMESGDFEVKLLHSKMKIAVDSKKRTVAQKGRVQIPEVKPQGQQKPQSQSAPNMQKQSEEVHLDYAEGSLTKVQSQGPGLGELPARKLQLDSKPSGEKKNFVELVGGVSLIRATQAGDKMEYISRFDTVDLKEGDLTVGQIKSLGFNMELNPKRPELSRTSIDFASMNYKLFTSGAGKILVGLVVAKNPEAYDFLLQTKLEKVSVPQFENMGLEFNFAVRNIDKALIDFAVELQKSPPVGINEESAAKVKGQAIVKTAIYKGVSIGIDRLYFNNGKGDAMDFGMVLGVLPTAKGEQLSFEKQLFTKVAVSMTGIFAKTSFPFIQKSGFIANSEDYLRYAQQIEQLKRDLESGKISAPIASSGAQRPAEVMSAQKNTRNQAPLVVSPAQPEGPVMPTPPEPVPLFATLSDPLNVRVELAGSKLTVNGAQQPQFEMMIKPLLLEAQSQWERNSGDKAIN